MNSVRPRVVRSIAANNASPMSEITIVWSSSDSFSRAMSRVIVMGSSGLTWNFSPLSGRGGKERWGGCGRIAVSVRMKSPSKTS